MTSACTKDRPIRVILQQGALPKYRIPVFRELANRPGIQLRLLYADFPGLPNEQPSGFDAQYIPMRRWNFLGEPVFWHSAQWDYATREHADVLVLSWDVHYASLIPSLLRARANGVPTVLWGHGYSKHEASWRKWLRWKIGALSTSLLFYNHGAARQLQEAGWDSERLYVALNSLDQTPIQQARQHWLDRPADLQAFREKEGLAPGPMILFVSRLQADNRVDLLLQAGAKLKNSHPNLKLVIIGKGNAEPDLRQLANSLNLSQHVRFLGSIYEESQLAPWFLSANVFCYPTNIGLSILHAFGYGLPVVTSDRLDSQNPEIESLRPGENGLLYSDGNVDALADVLRRILENPQLQHHLSDNALKTVQNDFNLKKMVDGYEAAIRYAHARASGIPANP